MGRKKVSLDEVLRANKLDPTILRQYQPIVVVQGKTEDLISKLKVAIIDNFISYDPATKLLCYGGAHNSTQTHQFKLNDDYFVSDGATYQAWRTEQSS